MSSGLGEMHDSDGSAMRADISTVLEDCARRRAEGEAISDRDIINAHPELMPELGEELRKLRIIGAARNRAFGSSTPGRKDIDEVLADYMRRLDGGERVDQEGIIAAHPELATELRAYFSQAIAVERMIDGTPTIDHAPSRKDSRGLHIRCPHCSNLVEVLTDTPYEEISCSTCGSNFSLVSRDDSTRMAAPLKSIDRFDLVTRLGMGGFGTVWKARDRDLDRTVAVKIPRRGQLSPAEIDQFFREARAAAQLRHANIVPVHEVGRDGETLFIVSDFVRGITLSDRLTGNLISPKEGAELCVPIADALHHAHQQGVIHRDLKPSNIMIDEDGRPHLMDFGLAKRELGEITMTVDGQILGTPGYMSPEQAGGQSHWTDRRTDIYSLGVIVFQMLTGELPFRGNAQMQIHQRLTEDAPDPRKLNRHIPRDLATICLKCLEREPGRRYATAAELGDEFRRFLRGEPIQARPLSAVARLGRWAKRKPMVATTGGLIVFLAMAGPLVALALERQRGQLQELVTEKNNLIRRLDHDKRQDIQKITELSDRLDLWEGRANPWKFWPPPPGFAQTQGVMSQLFSHVNTKLTNQWRDRHYDEETRVHGELSLAILAHALGHKADAITHYHKAIELLSALQATHADDPRIARTLAQCYADLSSLLVEQDRTTATKYLEQSRAILQRLAESQRTDAPSQIAWLQSELDSATMAGFDSAAEHLERASAIHISLPSIWPSEPVDVYRLACFLTQREQLLAPKSGDVP